MKKIFEAVTLEGTHVRLEPLATAHLEGLKEAIKDGELWKLFFTLVPHFDELDSFFERAQKEHANGEGLTFVTIDKKSGKIAGSTSFMRGDLSNKIVEIGFTFLGKSFQRTAINTEAKLLMLGHAFDELGLNRVQFMTDYFNTPSRNAILRLGAKQEGILRNHVIMRDERLRDTVVFSIIKNEWAGVRKNLEDRLG